MVGLLRHRQTKGPGTDKPSLKYRATLRLYRRRSVASFSAAARCLFGGGALGSFGAGALASFGDRARWLRSGEGAAGWPRGASGTRTIGTHVGFVRGDTPRGLGVVKASPSPPSRHWVRSGSRRSGIVRGWLWHRSFRRAGGRKDDGAGFLDRAFWRPLPPVGKGAGGGAPPVRPGRAAQQGTIEAPWPGVLEMRRTGAVGRRPRGRRSETPGSLLGHGKRGRRWDESLAPCGVNWLCLRPGGQLRGRGRVRPRSRAQRPCPPHGFGLNRGTREDNLPG